MKVRCTFQTTVARSIYGWIIMTDGERGVLNAALDARAKLFAENIRLQKKILTQECVIFVLVTALILRCKK